MRHGIQSGVMLTAGLLVACAAGPREVRDEGSERIEEAMRPEAHPELIPEGIALGEDAPPLAEPEPEVASPSAFVTSPASSEWTYGVPVIVPGPIYGPWPGPMRFNIEPRPGGSIPGLLP